MAAEKQAQGSVQDSDSFTDLERIIEVTCKHSGRTEAEVRKLIEEKQDELSGLVSEEGAAYIVARELGVNLLKAAKRQLKIKNLIPGLSSVELVGRVVSIFEPREWAKDGRSGVVQNMLVGDETGVVRLSLWNDETQLLSAGSIKEDDTIRILGGSVRADNRGEPELRVGRGRLEKVDEEVALPRTGEIKRGFGAARRKNLSELKEGEFAEARACLVKVFKRVPFYNVCPSCGATIAEENGKWACREHGEVKPEQRTIISGILDDGTGNMRVVFFGETAEKLLGEKAGEAKGNKGKPAGAKDKEGKCDPMAIYDSFPALGKEIVIKGRVKKNDLTGSMEIVANDVEEVDVKKEAECLIKELEK